MGPRFSSERNAFSDTLNNNLPYADKSLLIKDFIDDLAYAQIVTRPSGYCKTHNLSMLYHFFSIHEKNNKNYFEHLKIWNESQKYTSKKAAYPVIFLSFNNCEADTIDSFNEYYKKLIMFIYAEFQDILLNGVLKNNVYEQKNYYAILEGRALPVEIEFSLKKLTAHLYKQYNMRVILLIDDYDTVLYKNASNPHFNAICKALLSYFTPALQDNEFMYKSILTSVFPLSRTDSFSGINNTKHYSIFSNWYSVYFGFTQRDLRQLLPHCNMSLRYTLQENYGGYQIGKHEIFNARTILQLIRNNFENDTDCSLLHAPYHHYIRQILYNINESMKNKINILMNYDTIFECINEHVFNLINTPLTEKQIWGLLLQAGYLTIKSVSNNRHELYIANRSQHLFFEEIAAHWNNKFDTTLKSDNKISGVTATLFNMNAVSSTKSEGEDDKDEKRATCN